MTVVKIISDSYPQVKKDHFYTVEKTLPTGFVKLIGITHPIPNSAISYEEPQNKVLNYFVVTRNKVVQEHVIMSNMVGSNKLEFVQNVDSQELECYTKSEQYVENVSTWIMQNAK
jgi:hypothetical protein